MTVLTAHRSQQTPVQVGTRRARNQESEPPFRRDSRNCWQPEEKEMSVCTRRPSCPKDKRPRASERQIAEQVSVLFLLKLKLVISALSFLGKTFSLSREHMEANGGSTLLSRLVFRRTRDQEHMATQWATTLKSCSGQQQELDVETVTWRAHPRSLSHYRWSTDDTDILFRGGNTRKLTLASHSWAVLFQ